MIKHIRERRFKTQLKKLSPTAFFVRGGALDQSWVEELYKRLKAGMALEPIVVNAQFEIIDGRHRYAAYVKFFGGKEGMVTVVQRAYTDRIQEIAMAAILNNSLSKPMMALDLRHTIDLLVAEKCSLKDIHEKLDGPFGKIAVAREHNAIRVRNDSILQMKAVALVNTGNITLEKACEQVGVSPTAVRRRLTASRHSKRQMELSRSKSALMGMRSVSLKVSHSVNGFANSIIRDLSDGVINSEVAKSHVSYLRKMESNLRDRVEDLEMRVNHAIKTKEGQWTTTPAKAKSTAGLVFGKRAKVTPTPVAMVSVRA